VEQAGQEAPQGITLIVVSRADPPARFARLLASQSVALLGWADLRLTLGETRSIAEAKQALHADTLRLLHEQTDGWAAGLILMLERLKDTGQVGRLEVSETMETVFNYFTGQVFDQAPRATQELLIQTAHLPSLTVSMAETISGNPEAGRILDDLYHRHLFTDRRHAHLISYQYHALFRAFLQERAKKVYSVAECRALIRHSADLLEIAGDTEGAILLYREAGDWNRASELILTQAPLLLEHGRGQTLRDWIRVLPKEVVQSTPWLRYWLGASLIEVEPQQGRLRLEEAFDQFSRESDLVGQALAAAGIVQTYWIEEIDFTPLDRWIPILERLLAQEPDFPDPERELLAYSAMLVATAYRQPAHPLLKTYADKVLTLLELEVRVNQKIAAAFFLFTHCVWTADVKRGQRLIALITPLLADPNLTARYRALWYFRLGIHLWLSAEYKQAAESLAKGREIAHSHGLPIVPLLCNFQIYVASSTGDVATIERLVAEMEAAMASSRPTDYFYAHTARGTLAMLRGDRVGALRERRRAVELTDRIGIIYLQSICRHHLAQLLVQSEQLDEALRVASEAREIMKGAGFVPDESVFLLVEAYVALARSKSDECHRLLGQAFAISQQTGYYPYAYPHAQTLMPRLFAEALQAGIEVDYVRSAILKCGFVPESPDVEGWPWPMEIYCLGRFDIHLGGAPLIFSGKRQFVPMALLMALIALGGANVGVETLAALLWPDAEGDAAEKALDITLHRLRKLLGDDAALLRQNNKVSLNPRLCWVDVWAFERKIATADPLEQVAIPKQSPLPTAKRLLQLYRGPFLAHQCEEPWALQARQRLQEQFLRSVKVIGQHLEAAAQWEEAAALYRRGLEMDNLAEELYRRLILCLQAKGERAEALRVYRSCRDMLSVVLGVQPTPETQTLYRDLLDSGQDPNPPPEPPPAPARGATANP
jgi:DNA-binding SARP family transcriptional activator